MLAVVPAVVGAFWGAPLVARELEAGTHRLAWTQSVTRGRWLATRLGLTLLGGRCGRGRAHAGRHLVGARRSTGSRAAPTASLPGHG